MKLGQFHLKSFLWFRFLSIACIVLGSLLLFTIDSQSQDKPDTAKGDVVYTLSIDDEIISPIISEYVKKGINAAHEDGAKAVIIELDTPGGLLSSTHTIVKDIMNAPIPVIVYVSPAGARAGSAGTFITMAGHVAAMEPSSRIGAAHPVNSDGSWPGDDKDDDNKNGETDDSDNGLFDVMSEKILNDTVAFMRSLARRRGRNEDWAVKAIVESDSIPADDALKNNVVDFLAHDVRQVAQKAEGLTVDIQGENVTIHLDDPVIKPYEFTTQEQVLSILANPMIAYILLMIGFYGLVFEVTHPGFGVPGVIGAICFVLGLFGMQFLSLNFAGLGLIAVAIGLFIAEVYTASFGLLFAGGVVALIIGSFMLFQTKEPFLLGMVPNVIGVAVGAAIMTGILLYLILKTHKTKPIEPKGKLVGKQGRALDTFKAGGKGQVKVFGEVWDAIAEEKIPLNADIEVLEIDEENNQLKISLPVANKASETN